MRPGTVSNLFNVWPWHRAQDLDLGEHSLMEGRTVYLCRALDSSCEMGRQEVVFSCGVLVHTRDVTAPSSKSVDMAGSMLERELGAGQDVHTVSRGGVLGRRQRSQRLRGECPLLHKSEGNQVCCFKLTSDWISGNQTSCIPRGRHRPHLMPRISLVCTIGTKKLPPTNLWYSTCYYFIEAFSLPWVIYLCVILKMCVVIYSNAFSLLSTIFLFNQTLFTLTHHISVTATWMTGNINIQTQPPCPLPNSHFSSYFTFMRIFLSLCPDVFVTITLSSSKVIVLFFYYSLIWPRWNHLISVYHLCMFSFTSRTIGKEINVT